MLVKLIEVRREMKGGVPSLNVIYINSSHIISVTEDLIARESLIKETKQLGLIEGVRFSKVTISEGSQTKTLVVVGTPAEVHGKVKKRQVLRG